MDVSSFLSARPRRRAATGCKQTGSTRDKPLRIKLRGGVPSEAVIKSVLDENNGKCLLAFSAGKDAIAAWLALKAAGATVFPFYYYIHPDLEFVNSSLAYYEDRFETRIARYPAPALYHWWLTGTMQTPERVIAVLQSSLRNYGNELVTDAARMDYKLAAWIPVALGVRAADSINRRTMFVRSGAINHKAKKFYPVWDWTKRAVFTEIYNAKLKLPIDYWLFGRSFDGIDYRFIAPVKKHFPEDYARLLDYFPMLDVELKRAEFAGMKDHL